MKLISEARFFEKARCESSVFSCENVRISLKRYLPGVRDASSSSLRVSR